MQEAPVGRLEPTNYSYRIIREILFIDTYWIPDKFFLCLLADAKFSGMTGKWGSSINKKKKHY